MKKIYLDYAATTPVDRRVLKVMLPYFSEKFGNTMSLHSFGQEAKRILEESREVVADFLGAKSNEIIFTGSATESNNLALKGIAFANKNKERHIIISQIEHPCILESAKWLETQGFEVTRLKVDKYGLISPEDVKKAIKKDTILVSIMHANNEIGTIEPIEKIGKICREKGVLFHTDAAQSFGKIPINVNKMNIDLLTASSHKMYGPKGVALLFVREGTKIEPLLHGGGHESGLRSSTVNVPGILGFAEAVKICQREMKKEGQRLTKLRDKLIKGVLEKIPGSHLNGHPQKRLPNNINFSFDGVEGESIVMQLDFKGIAVSTGSACSSAKLEPNHVLLAIGLKPHQANGSLRLSLGRWTKESDIDYVLKVLPQIIKKLREMSPFKK
ncbi:MAG: cysteine desulfurase NifS [Minisyncoccia bacterium]